ncbi:divergent polysaccharide deacetylase family protein [Selenihalanaerobacter shriftii]|uniref:Divergent polysaccharide deacetylase n=1 Tax=Selenihalanaerobacter shriftii TaxID=142842 RepID=A0A1T4KJM5_9FIRM|nr:divergent polysaccharide deacetylase family protein [Selenihalanaerobacter shriftii]SJZ42601.1 hypothetical protein SAMN02745118_00811 [Selenihalanaerobacter shriftii]
MKLTTQKKIILLIIGVLIISVIAACSNPDVSEKKEEKIKELDYTKLSKEIKESINNYWNRQEIDVKSKLIEINQEEKIIDGKKIIWKSEKLQVNLPFPARHKIEIDRLIEGLTKSIDKQKIDFNLRNRLTKKNQEEALIEITFRPEEVTSETLVTYRLKLIQPQIKAKMAFVIDDLGFNRAGTEELLEIDRQITVAVLPFRPYSTQDAKGSKEAGHQVLLHLPMEPVSEVDPGAGAIYVDMSSTEIAEQIKKDIDNLGVDIAGVNNHMGSKATANEKVMEVVLDYLRKQELFFVDSSTAPNSVVPAMAQRVDEAYAVNYLFIDNVDNKAEVKKQIKKLAEVALKKGELITIGHVRPNTALAIQEMIPKLEEMGIQLVYVSELTEGIQ